MKMCHERSIRRFFLLALITAVISVSGVHVSDAKDSSAQVPRTKAFKFVQLCDTQLGFGGYEHDIKMFRQAVAQISAMKPDFVVICGDLVNKFDKKSVEDFKKIKAEFAVPCYCAAGNHDVGGKPTKASLRSYRQSIGKDYYSFDHKGYTFVVVDTSLWKGPLEGESEKHDAWVKQTLQKSKNKGLPVFVVGHHPLFVKNAEEKEEYYNLPLDVRKKLLALYESCGVVAVLAGHTHKTIVNIHKGIQFVNGECTSRNFDKRPLGFRLWTVASPSDIKHEFVPLKP